MIQPNGKEALAPAPPPVGIYEPTPGELEPGGYELEPTQTVAFEVSANPAMHEIGMQTGNGIEVQGKPVAEVRVGGVKESSAGTILETEAKGPADDLKKEYVVVFDGTSDGQPFAAKLERGRMLGIGRGYKGQDKFPGSVSRDHCAIGLDERGRVLVENHQPTNYTKVRRVGTFVSGGKPLY